MEKINLDSAPKETNKKLRFKRVVFLRTQSKQNKVHVTKNTLHVS
jgi:hypothetical protein